MDNEERGTDCWMRVWVMQIEVRGIHMGVWIVG